jgi:hypothetical protein
MEKQTYQANDTIHLIGHPLDSLKLILEGTISAAYDGGEILLSKGDCIGIAGVFAGTHLLTVRAVTQVTVANYAYDGEFMQFLGKLPPEVKGYFATSVAHQTRELLSKYKLKKADSLYSYNFYTRSYERYAKMCEDHSMSPRTLPEQEDIAPLLIEEDIDPWLGGYYDGVIELVTNAPDPARISLEFYCGLMMVMSRSISHLIILNNLVHEYSQNIMRFFINEERLDFFEMFTAAYFRIYHLADKEKPDTALIDDTIEFLMTYASVENDYCRSRIDDFTEKLGKGDAEKPAEEQKSDEKAAAALQGSLDVILEYAACPKEVSEAFRKELNLFKKTVNKSSTEDVDRKRRLVITKHFYTIYNAAVLKSLTDKKVPPIVQMFLHFGYVDEELAGEHNAAYLYNIVSHIPTDPARGVYTYYQWLQAIYAGKKEPSRNEFDNDYNDYILELKRNNKITKAQEADMLTDTRQKVIFDLDSVFPSVNKVTNGRIAIFCPVFSEHNVIKTLGEMLVSVDKVEHILADVRKKDFGAFCRETVFAQPEQGITKETINVEVLPDFILMPNVGSRGIMWQEIEGKRRQSPARFMLSLFQAEDLYKIVYRMVGGFRWEMCKRIQGARWNDASERSLTSDYCDYIATFRKNRDISSDVKEQIKSDLVKCKNSNKEMFIYDYMIWLQYESNGSPRLNKVVRTILFTYCPFSKEVRQKLRANPLYTDTLDKYDIRLKAQVRHMDNLFTSIRKKGHEVPAEIEETKRILLS